MKSVQFLTQTVVSILISAFLATMVQAAVFGIAPEYSGINSIIPGPDGAMWFTEPNVQQVGRITTNGTITEFSVPGVGEAITFGPDGNLWATGTDAISRITPSGKVTQFPVKQFAYIKGIAAGPDGNLWFTMWADDMIGRINLQGDISQFPVPKPATEFVAITPGPDGNLWFTSENTQLLGRITPQGTITEFPTSYGTLYIVSGPDGNLWISGYTSIGRFSPNDGTLTEFRPRTLNCLPGALTVGPDGNIWFVEPRCDAYGKITPQGVITEYPFPLTNSYVTSLAFGPDGQLWFTDAGNNKIVSLPMPVGTAPQLTSLSLTCPAQVVAEQNGGRCSATAKYADGSSADVSAHLSLNVSASLTSSDNTALSILPNSVHSATFGGDLIGGSVKTDTSVTLTATYTENGVTQKASASVLVKALSPLTTADLERIFRWAENRYPELFPGNSVTQISQGYTYRYYPKTGVYLAGKDGRMILHNGTTWNFYDVGSAYVYYKDATASGF